MKVRISPSKLKGVVVAQPSKSDAHRKLICAAFAHGDSKIDNVVLSDDIKATLRCLKAVRCTYEINNSSEFLGRSCIYVKGTGGKVSFNRQVDCGESGSTLRFMTMIFAVAGGKTVLTGSGRLPLRPMNGAISLLSENGIKCSYPGENKFLPLTIEGELSGGNYKIDSSVTSQYLSGLMMALPAFSQKGIIEATGEFESRGYVEVTKKNLKTFGVEVRGANPYEITANNGLIACNCQVDGDWSNASYFLVMKALGAELTIKGINEDSVQPDSIINKYIEKIIYTDNPIIDVSECPDIMPSLAVVGAKQKKNVKFIGGRRLREKESDRIKSVTDGLRNLSVAVLDFDDGLEIQGSGIVCGGEVDSYNDHRIAMAFSSLCTVATSDIVINGAESVAKSYPLFFEDLKKLGGKII